MSSALSVIASLIYPLLAATWINTGDKTNQEPKSSGQKILNISHFNANYYPFRKWTTQSKSPDVSYLMTRSLLSRLSFHLSRCFLMIKTCNIFTVIGDNLISINDYSICNQAIQLLMVIKHSLLRPVHSSSKPFPVTNQTNITLIRSLQFMKPNQNPPK